MRISLLTGWIALIQYPSVTVPAAPRINLLVTTVSGDENTPNEVLGCVELIFAMEQGVKQVISPSLPPFYLLLLLWKHFSAVQQGEG